MGEVYLAEDQKLARKVALKTLPAAVSGERRRLNRFLQEARLAANLNHPHICTIYEIDASADPPFLAMELVEGETLAEKIRAGALDLNDALDIASQIADALDEAHRADIIHRDIKSSNVIVNRRGQVKILDFGLAKIISEEVSEQDVTRAKTEDGMLVGTVQYMSPEHALGKKLDGRTDLWSLGVLLYEMLTGELPFRAATQAGTFDEILHRSPKPLADFNPQVPAELENIVFKLLEKDRDFRYQTASDLGADLKRLRRTLGDVADSNEIRRGSTSEIRYATQSGFARQSNIERRERRWSGAKAAFLLLLVLFLSGLGYAVWQYSFRPQIVRGFESAASTRVTNLGKVFDAVISPDGKYIVYVTDDAARQTLWIKQTETGSAVQIVPPSENVYQGLAISPDNNWVYFNVWDRRSVGQIFRIPALGGAPQKVAHDCMPSVSISPDGGKFVYVRSDDRNKKYNLLTANADGTGESEILSLAETYFHTPVWAPDGQSIAFGIFQGEADKRYPQIVEIPAAGGPLKTIWKNEENRFQPNRLIWLADRSGLLVTLNNSREFQSQIWKIDYQTGELQQITKDLNSYSSLSLSADGKNLLSIQQDILLSLWVVPVDNPSQARRVTDGKTEGIGLSWTPDDRIVYASNVSGAAEIWIMNADGSGKKQLTADRELKLNPCVAGDGRHVFYNIVGNERGGSARVDIDGKNPRVLDNKWNVTCVPKEPSVLYFADTGGGVARLFRDSSDFGSPLAMNDQSRRVHGLSAVKVVDKPVQNYAVSPDGKQIAYIFWDENKRENDAEIKDLETGAVRRFELPSSAVQKYGESQYVIRYTADGRNLSFINDENGFANVWILPLNGDKPRRATAFNDNFIFSFGWSADGRRLAVSRGTLTSDAVLMRLPK